MGKVRSKLWRTLQKYSQKELRFTVKTAKEYQADCESKAAAYTKHASEWALTRQDALECLAKRKERGKK